MDARKHLEVAQELSRVLDGVLAEHVGEWSDRDFRTGATGDLTFEVDEPVEAAVKEYFGVLEFPSEVVTEDLGRGRFGSGEPEALYVIDPLDGSRNARRSLPVYSASVAVYPPGAEKLSEAEVGVVHRFDAPEEYTAVRGEGAFLNNNPIKPSGKKSLDNAVVAVGAHFASAFAVHVEVLEALSRRRSSPSADLWTKAYGSTALELAFLASGRVDVILDLRASTGSSFTPKTYDVAAGVLLASEAGAHLLYGGSRLPEELGLDHTQPVQLAGAGSRELMDEIKTLLHIT